MAVAAAAAAAAIGQVDGAGEGSREEGSEGSKPTCLGRWSSCRCRCLGRRARRSSCSKIQPPIGISILRFQKSIRTIAATAAAITGSGRCNGGSAASRGAAGGA